MQDTPGAICPPFTGQVIFITFKSSGELDPPLNQITFSLGPFFNHHSDNIFVTDAGTGNQGIFNMCIKGLFT